MLYLLEIYKKYLDAWIAHILFSQVRWALVKLTSPLSMVLNQAAQSITKWLIRAAVEGLVPCSWLGQTPESLWFYHQSCGFNMI